MLLERKDHIENDEVGNIECIYSSDNIIKTTYFPKSRRLYIAFGRGHTYSYANISDEMYNEFENSDSQGKYFHKHINNKKEFPSRKEFTLYPNEVNEIKNNINEHIDLNDYE